MSNNDNIINIAYCGDKKYLPYIGISMTSIIYNMMDRKINFHIMIDDINQDDYSKLIKIQKLYKCVESIRLYSTSKYKKELMDLQLIKTGYPISTFYRILLLDALNDDVNKIIYLDGDVICQNDFYELLSMDLNNCCVGMAPDINGAASYFNAGVMVVDTKRWKDKDILAKFVDIAKTEPKLAFPDQDILNHILNNEIYMLPSEYNRQVPCNLFVGGKEVKMEPFDKLIHYIGGGTRPWEYLCFDNKAILWHEYREVSAWKNIQLTGSEFIRLFMDTIKNIYNNGNTEKAIEIYLELNKYIMSNR